MKKKIFCILLCIIVIIMSCSIFYINKMNNNTYIFNSEKTVLKEISVLDKSNITTHRIREPFDLIQY